MPDPLEINAELSSQAINDKLSPEQPLDLAKTRLMIDDTTVNPTSSCHVDDIFSENRNRDLDREIIGELQELQNAVGQLHACSEELSGDDGRELLNVIRGRSSSLKDKFSSTIDEIGLKELLSLDHEVLRLLPEHHPDRFAFFDNLATGMLIQFKQFSILEDVDEAITLRREVVALCPDSHPNHSLSLNNLAVALKARYEHLDSCKDLDEVIGLHRQALVFHSASHPYRDMSLNNLANALFARFQRSGVTKDLDEAIVFHQESLELCSAPGSDRSTALNNLAAALLERSERSNVREDLERAIVLLREALVQRPSPHPDRPSSLNNLSQALLTRFEQLGHDNDDLDDAIILGQEALALCPAPHADRSTSLINLGNVLLQRFGLTGSGEDANSAIALYREGLFLCPAPHPDRAIFLNNLANALVTRYKQFGEQEDLHEAIIFHREALYLHPAPHPDRITCLDNLAVAVYARFLQSGGLQDLDEAISLQREALAFCPASDTSRPMLLNHLANTLCKRCSQPTAGPGELDEAIDLLRTALILQHTSHPARSETLNNLANSLATRFGTSGSREDLDEALGYYRETLSLHPTPHPERSSVLINLANSLLYRFEQFHSHGDLDEAILRCREALMLCPAPHPGRHSRLTILANGLFSRFQQSGGFEDLDEGISLLQEALNLSPAPHPGRIIALDSLAMAVFARFQQLNAHEDLDESIVLYQEALSLSPAPHPYRYQLLNGLANTKLERFKQRNDIDDLAEAISLHRESVDALVPGHPFVCTNSSDLAEALLKLYSRDHELKHLNESMVAFQVATASQSSPVSGRLRAARLWAGYAESYGHDSASEAYEQAIKFLPQLASLGQNLRARQESLAATDGLARRAAVHAIRSGRYEKAIELLEAGRAVFWTQALQLRTPMDNLRTVAPELATQLSRLSAELERGSHRDIGSGFEENEQKQVMEKEASYFSRLNENWVETLEKVRRLNGFQDFLQPSRISTLQAAAATGLVVILIASYSQSDALVMDSSSVRHLQLRGINLEKARILTSRIRSSAPKGMRSLRNDLTATESTISHDRYGHPAVRQPRENFREILETLWEAVVEPLIRFLDLKKTTSPPTIRWCPTGLFSFLPLHAAGIYGSDMSSVDSASDYIVSSYTPTIGALLLRQQPNSPRPVDFKMMIAIEPKTLPSTIYELQKVQMHVPSDCLVKLGIPGSPASVNSVLSHLSNISIAHFACHGKQDSRAPLDSALVLEDGDLKMSRIIQQPIPHASLAFLCACETAMGDDSVPDEAMHLGATLLFSGFRGVIATMWSINDADGPIIADAFYGHLFQGGSSPDMTRAAQAIQGATAKLRGQNAAFQRWVPFIHLGN